MYNRIPSIVGGLFAGFILGTIGYVFFGAGTPDARAAAERLHASICCGVICASLFAVVGAVANRRLAPRTYMAIVVFAVFTAIPCIPTGKGSPAPLAGVYVHRAPIWPAALLAHMIATGLVTVAVTAIAKRMRRLETPSKNLPDTN